MPISILTFRTLWQGLALAGIIVGSVASLRPLLLANVRPAR